MDDAKAASSIHWGLLGWSNKRIGVEFYRYDEKIIPRHNSEWGDLLTQEIGDQEGCPVIVIVLPRSASKDDVIAATAAVKRGLDADA